MVMCGSCGLDPTDLITGCDYLVREWALARKGFHGWESEHFNPMLLSRKSWARQIAAYGNGLRPAGTRKDLWDPEKAKGFKSGSWE